MWRVCLIGKKESLAVAKRKLLSPSQNKRNIQSVWAKRQYNFCKRKRCVRVSMVSAAPGGAEEEEEDDG